MKHDSDNKTTSSYGNMASLISSVLMLLNGVFSAYVLNYKPKIGEYHIWLCTILGVLLALTTILGIIWCIQQFRKDRCAPKLTIVLLVLVILMGGMWTRVALPYYKDLAGNSKTVVTDNSKSDSG